jgi:hypothetical protein
MQAQELERQLPRLLAIGAAINRASDDAVIEAYDQRRDTWLDSVEALPATPDNARIKAMAIGVIHCFDFDDYGGDDTCTDTRLVRQILAGLVQQA